MIVWPEQSVPKKVTFWIAGLALIMGACLNPLCNPSGSGSGCTVQRWVNSVLMTKYEYDYHSTSQKWSNANTNIIKKIINYEYKYRSPSQKWLNYSLISGPAKELFFRNLQGFFKKKIDFRLMCIYIYVLKIGSYLFTCVLESEFRACSK